MSFGKSRIGIDSFVRFLKLIAVSLAAFALSCSSSSSSDQNPYAGTWWLKVWGSGVCTYFTSVKVGSDGSFGRFMDPSRAAALRESNGP